MAKYIFSTLTADQRYVEWVKSAGRMIEKRSFFVNGGHGVANEKTLLTPIGMVTPIEDEDYKWLKEVQAFKDHVKNGFIVVKDKAQDAEKVASEMDGRDKSSQLTESDFTARGKKAPKINKTDKDM